jgi:hypothetical protein
MYEVQLMGWDWEPAAGTDFILFSPNYVAAIRPKSSNESVNGPSNGMKQLARFQD